MVDPVDLAFGEDAEEVPVEILRRAQIGPERLLDDHAPPVSVFPQQTDVSKPLGNDSERLWRRCEIEQIVAARVLGHVGLGQEITQPRVDRRVIEVTRQIGQAAREPISVVTGYCAIAELAKTRRELMAKVTVVLLAASNSNYGKVLR